MWVDPQDERGLSLLTPIRLRTYVRSMAAGNLTEERLESIERGARERRTLLDRVVLELVEEVRRLRGIIARIEEQ
jgi:hypothetical protein